MKVKLQLKKKETKAKQRRSTTFADYKDDFDSLDPVKLSTLGVVAPKALRPHFCRRAQETGAKYASLAVDAENAVYFLVE